MRHKSYKYRMYPTKEQEILLGKTFGCVRFVYNKALFIKTSTYQNEKRSISVFSLISQLKEWKNCDEFIWLKEVSAQALQMSLRNLDNAFTKYFKKITNFPKFKSKSDNHNSFCNPQYTSVDFDSGLVYFPKFKEGIKTVFDRRFSGKIKSSIISKTPSGKYFISITIESDKILILPPAPEEKTTIGIDLGISKFAVFSNGKIIENPKHLYKKLKQLKRQQRKLSRKRKNSKNRNKQRIKLARLHEKVANQRKDFLHKMTHGITKNQSFSTIAIENLDIDKMIQNGPKSMSRNITAVGWGMFRAFLTYKCIENSKNLLIIGRFDPSSKLCTCGYLNNNLLLNDREWNCPQCKAHHNRDLLAANNIKRFAFCKQNTISVGLVSSEPIFSNKDKTPLETCVSESLNKEPSQKGIT